jgi:hypothetical protein
MSQTRSMLSFLLTSNIIQSYILIFKSTRREFRPQRRMLVRVRQELKRCHGARALIYSLSAGIKNRLYRNDRFWRKAVVDRFVYLRFCIGFIMCP